MKLEEHQELLGRYSARMRLIRDMARAYRGGPCYLTLPGPEGREGRELLLTKEESAHLLEPMLERYRAEARQLADKLGIEHEEV